MDYVLKELNQYRSHKTKANFTPFSECFRFPAFNANSVNKKQLYTIRNICETTTLAIHAIWGKEYYTLEEKYLLSQQYKEELISYIQKLKINQHTLFVLITYIDNKKYSQISKLLFYLLFHYKNNTLIELMYDLQPSSSYIKEAANGEIDLYGIKFKRYGGNHLE